MGDGKKQLRPAVHIMYMPAEILVPSWLSSIYPGCMLVLYVHGCRQDGVHPVETGESKQQLLAYLDHTHTC